MFEAIFFGKAREEDELSRSPTIFYGNCLSSSPSAVSVRHRDSKLFFAPQFKTRQELQRISSPNWQAVTRVIPLPSEF